MRFLHTMYVCMWKIQTVDVRQSIFAKTEMTFCYFIDITFPESIDMAETKLNNIMCLLYTWHAILTGISDKMVDKHTKRGHT